MERGGGGGTSKLDIIKHPLEKRKGLENSNGYFQFFSMPPHKITSVENSQLCYERSLTFCWQ